MFFQVAGGRTFEADSELPGRGPQPQVGGRPSDFGRSRPASADCLPEQLCSGPSTSLGFIGDSSLNLITAQGF